MMSEDLKAAMRGVHISAASLDADEVENWITEDPGAAQKRPRERDEQSAEDLKKELEHEFLTPSPKFSPQWLNRLQQ